VKYDDDDDDDDDRLQYVKRKLFFNPTDG